MYLTQREKDGLLIVVAANLAKKKTRRSEIELSRSSGPDYL